MRLLLQPAQQPAETARLHLEGVIGRPLVGGIEELVGREQLHADGGKGFLERGDTGIVQLVGEHRDLALGDRTLPGVGDVIGVGAAVNPVAALLLVAAVPDVEGHERHAGGWLAERLQVRHGPAAAVGAVAIAVHHADLDVGGNRGGVGAELLREDVGSVGVETCEQDRGRQPGGGLRKMPGGHGAGLLVVWTVLRV